MKQAGEGVIKFRLDHEAGTAPPGRLTASLRGWFRILRKLELVGRRPDRYLGYAYGNLSRRTDDGLLVTCTQTSGLDALDEEHFTRVTEWDLAANRLRSTGPCRPSSETLTHAMIYEAVAQARWVFHAHAPEIWERSGELEIPVTDPRAEYGTPEMARAVAETLKAMGHPASGVLSMGGHEDGIVAWGTSAEEAGCGLLDALAKALTCGYGSPTPRSSAPTR